MVEAKRFDYVASDAGGKRVRGTLSAGDEQAAFERLKRQGLTPIKLTTARSASRASRGPAPRDKESAEILQSLGDLLAAGADMRSALAVLTVRSEGSRVAQACKRLSDQISGGEALETAFAQVLAPRHGFVSALVAAGEASGDLPGGLRRAGEMLQSDLKLREQLISTLAYPAFVLFSTLAAAAVILLAVVPSLEPLVAESGGEGPTILGGLLMVSRFLRDNAAILLAMMSAVVFGIVLASRAGLLARPLDRLLLIGPWRKTTGAIFYGGFSMSLGSMLASGAPMSGALRLAIRGVRSSLARDRLEAVAQAVRQGISLSEALGRVSGFPPAVVRLVAVGEATGALGTMLQRAGKVEEEVALRRIEAWAKLLGPALIILLGGLIGLMMVGLLSGVTELGQAALQ